LISKLSLSFTAAVALAIVLGTAAAIPSAARGEELDGAGIVELIEMANKQCTRGTTSECSIATATYDGTAETGQDSEPSIELERVTIKDRLGRDLPVSVISEDSIRALRNAYPSDLRVYDEEVCAQRAHTIGHTLGLAGIETQKLYLEPGGWWPFKGHIVPDSRAKSSSGRTPYWTHHVVNFIFVKDKSGRLQEYIIDPFMEGLAVPRAQWEQRLRTNPSSSIGSINVISRFNFGPDDSSQALTDYDSEKLQGSYRVMSGDKRY
jgi:hypothetical protein